MNTASPRVCWVIQANMLSEHDTSALREACRAQHHRCEDLVIPPFSEKIPDFSHDGPVLFYGSARLTVAIAARNTWSPGVFFDPATFNTSAYRASLEHEMLNSDAIMTTLGEVFDLSLEPKNSWFVRPDADDKSFAGCVMTTAELLEWCDRLRRVETTLAIDTPILIASPKAITREWRLFMIDEEVVTGSQYRRGDQRELDGEVPADVLEYAAAIAARWRPARAFVMDVARTRGGALKVVEFNGINSSGFYAADIARFVAALSELAIMFHVNHHAPGA